MSIQNSHDALDELLEAVESQKAKAVEEARKLVNDYWDWFNDENTRISGLRKNGVTSLKCSNIAPVVEIKRSGSKQEGNEIENIYIVWKNHNPLFRKQLRKVTGPSVNASKRLHTSTSKYIMNILDKVCTWDKDYAQATEIEFEALRIRINGIHQAHMRLRSAKRALNKRTETAHTHDEETTEEISYAS